MDLADNGLIIIIIMDVSQVPISGNVLQAIMTKSRYTGPPL